MQSRYFGTKAYRCKGAEILSGCRTGAEVLLQTRWSSRGAKGCQVHRYSGGAEVQKCRGAEIVQR